MSAHLVFVRDKVTDEEAVDRYRERTPAARYVHPLERLCVMRLAASRRHSGCSSLAVSRRWPPRPFSTP
jgi:hypothetical protein